MHDEDVTAASILHRLVPTVLAAAMLLGACSPPERRASRTASLPRDAGRPSAAGSARNALFEAKLAERDTVIDWRNTIFGSRAPNPPVKARARRIPKKAPFAADSVATIRAYHYRHSYSGNAHLEIGETSRDLPFSADGRLDERVVGAEVELTADEQRRVLALITDAENARKQQQASGRVVSRALFACDFAAHHVLVFFDAAGIPVAKLFVCLKCHELQMLPEHPAMGGIRPGAMTDVERQALKAILDAHGLAAWIYDGDDPMRTAVDEYEARVYGTATEYTPEGMARNARRAALPSGVTPEMGAAQLSKAERKRLCVWLDAEVHARAKTRPNGVALGNYECDNGHAYSLSEDTMASCETQKVRDVPVGRIEACLRSSFLDGHDRVCRSGPAPECEGVLDSLPGVVWRR